MSSGFSVTVKKCWIFPVLWTKQTIVVQFESTFAFPDPGVMHKIGQWVPSWINVLPREHADVILQQNCLHNNCSARLLAYRSKLLANKNIIWERDF
jgi:hypothetical protein